MSEGETPSERGVNRGSGYLANVGTSFKTDGKEFPSVVCVCFTGNFGERKYSAMHVFR